MIKKIFLAGMLGLTFLKAVVTLEPILSIEVNGTTKDMVVLNNELIVGTDKGLLQVYDYETQQFIKEIALPKVKDFMGDLVAPRVFSVDKLEGKYLLLSDSGKGGYANLWIEKAGILTQLFNDTSKRAVIKARFIDVNHVLLGLLSNEAVLFNVELKKELYRIQLNESKFSDFALNDDKSQAVFACESGILNIIDIKTGKIVKVLKGVNVDNVYKVDFKKNIIAGAGQDRRGSLYEVSLAQGSYIEGSFLIYATGLSPSAKRVAFTMDEKNNISVYNRQTKEKIALLEGQKSTLNTIVFKDENILFSASDDSRVLMWNLKKKEK
ncbi:MAG: Periplasmic nitrate reductase component NapL [uncultured Sulfurovum sp.]|uniref:Periplasmic nitrate reductase component NapL n=1 Tax=uncultured Sulfurovum sp. TaxID=269237 RepID=A0A6S6SBD7_9BACT|nr:MAG: Periplasmic nitrate reductase component NapL [uncultured Sulfurovum sp.]